MREKSSGFLLYKIEDDELRFLVCKPGGPYGRRSDDSSWSIPKGKIEDGEEPKDTAYRETEEEIGVSKKDIRFIDFLGIAKQKRKDTHFFFGEYLPKDFELKENIIEIEWPKNSGKKIQIPEIGKAEFVSSDVARERLLFGQDKMIDEAINYLASKT